MTPIERAAHALAAYVPEPIAEQAARAVLQAIREPMDGEDWIVAIQRRVMIDGILAEGA